MSKIRAKKFLGQHFLTDLGVAQNIVNSLSLNNYNSILEVGPGMGVLTQFLLPLKIETHVIEIDRESVDYLKKYYSEMGDNIIEGDFLKFPIASFFKKKLAIIGNFPYNISTQILFKVLENKDLIPEVVGMFQKEVAERITSPLGNKKYGITSVLLQCYYNIEYLFTVEKSVFMPTPKVDSAVIQLKRNNRKQLDCDEVLFKQVVKVAFGQRRKTLRNALKILNLVDKNTASHFLTLRAEQLSVENFITLTNCFKR